MAATRNFFKNEKILFLAKVIEFSNHEYTNNYIVRANFNHDFPKINFKFYLILFFKVVIIFYADHSRDHVQIV